MLDSTLAILRATLQADPTITPAERNRLIAQVRAGIPVKSDGGPAPPPARIVRRGEVAQRLSCSLRAVDHWAKTGLLHKVRLPGRTRAAGFAESEIIRLIESRLPH
jgi:hypothetical protein